LIGACLAVPAAARADFNDDNTCRGHIAQGPKDPLGLNDNPIAYKFSCQLPITGYSIISDKSIDSWDTEVFVDDANGQVLGNESFSCNGLAPGFSVNCVGTYGANQHVVTASYNLEKDKVCTEPRTDPLLLVAYATYAKNSDGSAKLDKDGNPTVTTAMAGPFDLGRPRGCKASKYSGKTRIPQETGSSPDTTTRSKSARRR
jgi:hypothetical protein